ncbi:MAG: hypothetical protein AAGG08_03265, partial [Actinomycetota bacterium]
MRPLAAVVGCLVLASCGSSSDDAGTSIDTVAPTETSVAVTSSATTAAETTTTDVQPTVAPSTTTTAPTTTVAPTTTDRATTTTVASSAPVADAASPGDLASLVECNDGVGCTQILEAPSGALLLGAATEPTITRIDGDEITTFEVDLDVRGFGGLDGAWMYAVGPDDVAYIGRQTATTDDPIGDLAAVSTTGPDAGRVIVDWTQVLELSGDTDYVPTAGGLVPVGCCGFDPVRPAPDAPLVVDWVGLDGELVIDPGPHVTMVTGDGGNALVVSDAGGERSFPLPTVAQTVRGMPWVQVLDDGGLVAAFFDPFSGASYYAVWRADAADTFRFSEGGKLFLHSYFLDDELVDGPSVLALRSSGEAIVRSADGVVSTTDVDRIGPEMAPLRLDRDDWTVVAGDANDTIAESQPEWARSAVLVAQATTIDWFPNEQVVIETIDATSGGDRVTVTVTSSGFLDDSVFA